MSEFGKWEDGVAMPTCFSCGPEDEKHGIHLPAEMICMVKKADGSFMAMPLCLSHAQLGLVAGWFPQHKLNSPEGRKAWDECGYANPARRGTA